MEYLLILGLTMLWQKETKIFFIPFLVVVILKRYIMYWYYYWLYNISHYDYMCMLLVSTKNMRTKAKIKLYLFIWNFLQPDWNTPLLRKFCKQIFFYFYFFSSYNVYIVTSSFTFLFFTNFKLDELPDWKF